MQNILQRNYIQEFKVFTQVLCELQLRRLFFLSARSPDDLNRAIGFVKQAIQII